MDEELETLVLKVRADTREFGRDVDAMTNLVEGQLQSGMNRAGRAMEGALKRFIRTGKFGFEDLKRTALSVMNEIASSALRSAIGSIGGSGGLLGSLAGIAGSLLGIPGRATGGPVSPGQAYVVGERGPELFVPTASGRVEAGQARTPVNITVNVHAPADASPTFMAKSGRQVARAVRGALARADAP